MKGLKSAEVPPGGWKAVLQEFATALTRRLKKLDVAPEPCLSETGIKQVNSSSYNTFTHQH